MKAIAISVATFALIRAVAAFLSHSQPDRYEQLLHQPARYQALVKNLAASHDFVEVAPVIPDLAQQRKTTDSDTHGTLETATSQFSVGSDDGQWAIVYHPYNADGTCRTKATVHANLETIAAKGFHSIRLHNHDCNILPKLSTSPLVSSHKIRLILGIHIDEDGLPAASKYADDVVAWGSKSSSGSDDAAQAHEETNWSFVELVVVGEEVIFNGHASAAQLAAFIARLRSSFRRAGYTGPLTTTEPINVLYESRKELCPQLDVLASNIHPFFHTDVSAEHAGLFVHQTLELISTAICSTTNPEASQEGSDVSLNLDSTRQAQASSPSTANGRHSTSRPLQVVNLETGWPWRGRPNGEAVPGKRQQRVALEGVMRHAGGSSVVLGFGDDEWMEEGEFGVEGSWGCDELFPTKQS